MGKPSINGGSISSTEQTDAIQRWTKLAKLLNPSSTICVMVKIYIMALYSSVPIGMNIHCGLMAIICNWPGEKRHHIHGMWNFPKSTMVSFRGCLILGRDYCDAKILALFQVAKCKVPKYVAYQQ